MGTKYYIKVYFERQNEAYFYTGHSSNLGYSFSNRRRDAWAVSRYTVGETMSGIMAQHEVYHAELILA